MRNKATEIIYPLEDYEEIFADVFSLLEKAELQAYKVVDTLCV